MADVQANAARLRCEGQDHDSILLLGGVARKRLHHISLRADHLDAIARMVPEHGGRVAAAPAGFEGNGLWIEDPNGMLIHLNERPADPELIAGAPYEINAPRRVIRKRRSAMMPSSSYASAKPLRLGHILVFSPDVMKSVEFMTEALGMGLADRAQEVIAFCCAREDSDHHVVAFAKSPSVGFHHASFQVSDPDEVGRGGARASARRRPGGTGVLVAIRSDPTSSTTSKILGDPGLNTTPIWITSTTTRSERRPITRWRTVWPTGVRGA